MPASTATRAGLCNGVGKAHPTSDSTGWPLPRGLAVEFQFLIRNVRPELAGWIQVSFRSTFSCRAPRAGSLSLFKPFSDKVQTFGVFPRPNTALRACSLYREFQSTASRNSIRSAAF